MGIKTRARSWGPTLSDMKALVANLALMLYRQPHADDCS